ncbi:MAG: hypothetical protein Q8K60_09120 [Parachlamydiaceae bacterium]|nr:hypothetical protein [Parachlamydiaceae bacterium]
MNTAIISYRPPQLRGTIGPNVYTQKEEKGWFQGRKVIVVYNVFMKDLKDPVMNIEKIVNGYLFQRLELVLSQFYNNLGLPAEVRFFIKTIENEYKTWYLCYSPIKFAFHKKCEENILKLEELHEELKLKCNENKLKNEEFKLKYNENKLKHKELKYNENKLKLEFEELKLKCNESKLECNESKLKFEELKLKSKYDESSEKFTKEGLIDRFASFIDRNSKIFFPLVISVNILAISIFLSILIKNRSLKLGKI